MTDQTPDETFATLKTMLKGMAEQDEREYATQKWVARTGFFGAIPDEAKTLYIHLSHFISEKHHLVQQLQKNLGIDNVLVTIAPETSGQSFYDDSRDKIALAEKRKQITEPFENFSAMKGIDAVIYLCRHLCDGYQDPYFPDQISTKWHIWPAIKAAEQLQKPLIVGGQDIDHCYSGTIGRECCPREYITGYARAGLASSTTSKLKCPGKIVRI